MWRDELVLQRQGTLCRFVAGVQQALRSAQARQHPVFVPHQLCRLAAVRGGMDPRQGPLQARWVHRSDTCLRPQVQGVTLTDLARCR